MGLVEDAKRLADAGSYDDGGNGSLYEPSCIHCCGFPDDPHKPDCPWLAMPRIVRALEAAQALVDADSMAEEALARRALVAAMQGD